jgi:uroporphyrinogen decarboxylase
MNKKERVLAAIEGRMEAIDRPPVSVWYHFGSQFLSGRKFGDLEAAFFRHYDFDFLKMMNDYPWPLPHGLASVEKAEELALFGPLTMEEQPFREQRAALARAARLIGKDAFVIDTVFNPWGVARRTLKKRPRSSSAKSRRECLTGCRCAPKTCADTCARRRARVSGGYSSPSTGRRRKT